MFDYIFFDLDGTLTDSSLGITNSFIYALKYYGEEIPSYKKLCTFIGPPLLETFKTQFGFNDEKSAEAVKKYREYFESKGLFENSVYQDIPEILQKFKTAGKHLVVATSKPEKYSVQILEFFNLAKYFDFICGSNMDESHSKKDEIIASGLKKCNIKTDDQKSKVIMIGDRLHDIIGAKKNGIKSAGVLFGFGNLSELQNAGADYIIKTVTDLERFL